MTTYWEQIPARPTTYRGIEMRSRLEAQFAAFLDNQGEPFDRWAYEGRAYGNRRGQYLPDFLYRADDGMAALAIEVKPTEDAAFAVMPRMQIIWESVPKTVLMVAVPVDEGWLFWLANPEKDGGRWSTFWSRP